MGWLFRKPAHRTQNKITIMFDIFKIYLTGHNIANSITKRILMLVQKLEIF
jgi:hypothetical protein